MENSLISQCQAALVREIQPLLIPRVEGHRIGKIIHDPIWGTCRFEPWEAALLDMPIFQRLRGIKQTGFAHFTYPSAEHSRFQHTLGVVTAASKIIESLSARIDENAIHGKGEKESFPWLQPGKEFIRYRAMVRLAALVHDLGHSFYSHTSERFYRMLDPFPALQQQLKQDTKMPGAAEIVVFLIVTSDPWIEAFNEILKKCKERNPSISLEIDRGCWEKIGRWVMGHEADKREFVLAEIISGPLDADKLDYIARDAYFSGIPVGHDYERYVSLVCLDYQENSWRLTLPYKAINALEQLVMGRLALTSYLYHHQKVRAAEIVFERLLAREKLKEGGGKYLEFESVWELFASEDADVYSFAKRVNGGWRRLLERDLPVRYLEFRERDVQHPDRESTVEGFEILKDWTNSGRLDLYQELLDFEELLAKELGLEGLGVYVDIPKTPNYDDLGNLRMPARSIEEDHSVGEDVIYKQWINAYKANRSYVRIFGPKGLNYTDVFSVIARQFEAKLGITLQQSNSVPR